MGGFLIAEPSNVTRGNERKRLFAQMTGFLRLEVCFQRSTIVHKFFIDNDITRWYVMYRC